MTRAAESGRTGTDQGVALLTSIARMYYVDGLGQQEIAEIVGVSRSRVSRALSEARDEGIVRISVGEYEPRDAELEKRLRERYGLRHAVVVSGIGRTAESVRRAVGYYGAPAVAELIDPTATLGLAGGRTIRDLIAFIGRRKGAKGATVVQLMGNTGPNPTDVDALELSRILAQRLGGSLYTINAPAFAQDARSRDVFLAHEHIRTVWSLFASLQLALVGVGTLEESVFVERSVLDQGDLARLREAGAVGEICGRFFDDGGVECDTEYRHRAVSIDLGTLRRCPDVVAVTSGALRTTAIRAAIAGRLVTSLVIDDRGAAALLEADGTP